MKKIQTLITLFLLITISKNMQATVPEFEEEGSKLNLWIPGFLMKVATSIAEDFVEGEDAAEFDLLSKFGGMTICIREGEFYKDKSDKKITRKIERLEKRNYQELVSIISDRESVNMSIKENKKGIIKRMVVLVDDPGETYVFLKMHCKFSPDDISQITKHFTDIKN